MIGRRLPVVPGQFPALEKPGDYCGPMMGWTGDKPAVFFLKPNAHDADAPRRARSVQYVLSPPHTFRECADGSLEIRNSLGATAGPESESDGWHGYLDEGHVWRLV
jgi:hypothetical protein